MREKISNNILVTGTCLPMFGKKEGESCYMDTDCETGYVCMEGYSGKMECREPQPGVAKFGKLKLKREGILFLFSIF